jgi:hypothetical protein
MSARRSAVTWPAHVRQKRSHLSIRNNIDTERLLESREKIEAEIGWGQRPPPLTRRAFAVFGVSSQELTTPPARRRFGWPDAKKRQPPLSIHVPPDERGPTMVGVPVLDYSALVAKDLREASRSDRKQ